MKTNSSIRRDVKEFGGNKPFVPKGFQVAKRVDGPQVKLLKSIKRDLNKLITNPKVLISKTTIELCVQIINKRIEKVKKIEGSYIKIPKQTTK